MSFRPEHHSASVSENLVASAELEVPIAATVPLDNVRAAFELLEQGHTRGKIVLLPGRSRPEKLTSAAAGLE